MVSESLRLELSSHQLLSGLRAFNQLRHLLYVYTFSPNSHSTEANTSATLTISFEIYLHIFLNALFLVLASIELYYRR